MTELSQEDVLRRGIRAAQILDNEELMEFIGDYRNRCLEAIANTDFHESKTREANYAKHHVLGEVLKDLDQYWTTAQMIMNAQETHQRDALGDLGEPKETD